MVTFCTVCGTSLPLADVLIARGKELTHPDYHCPECGDFAAEEAHHKRDDGEDIGSDDDVAFVLKAGVTETQVAAAVRSRLAAHISATRGPGAHADVAVHAAVEAGHGGTDLVLPPDDSLLEQLEGDHRHQPSLPAVPATDENVQEELGSLDEFIERPE